MGAVSCRAATRVGGQHDVMLHEPCGWWTKYVYTDSLCVEVYLSCVDLFVHSLHIALAIIMPFLTCHAIENITHAHTGPATLLLRPRLRRVGGPRRRRARSSAKDQERSRLRPRGGGPAKAGGGERRLGGDGRKVSVLIFTVFVTTITTIGEAGEVRLDPGGRTQMAG